MGEVPVLEHCGHRLSQSGVILDYLAESLGKFGPADCGRTSRDPALAAVGQPQAHELHATYRFLRAFTKEPDSTVLDVFRKRAESAWRVLDAHLAGRSYVVDDRLTIADLSLCGYLYFADEIGVDWAAYPGIARWLERYKQKKQIRAALGASVQADAGTSVAAAFRLTSHMPVIESKLDPRDATFARIATRWRRSSPTFKTHIEQIEQGGGKGPRAKHVARRQASAARARGALIDRVRRSRVLATRRARDVRRQHRGRRHHHGFSGASPGANA